MATQEFKNEMYELERKSLYDEEEGEEDDSEFGWMTESIPC